MMDKERFAEEVLKAERSLYCTAKSLLSSDEDCADAMQNAILKAWQNLHTLKEPRYFKTWLTRILLNECYGMLRSRRNTVSYDEYMSSGSAEEPSAEEALEPPEVFEAVRQLPERFRLPVILHYLNGFTVKETAELLACSEGAAKMRLSRARELLRKTLTTEEGEEET